MVTTVLMLALAALSAAVIFASVQDEQEILRYHRQSMEAREAAEGGLMEVMNDQRLSEMLPDLATPSLRRAYTPSGQSVFSGGSAHRTNRAYTANIQLVRIAPMTESSHNVVRAVLYEVEVESISDNGASAGVEAEVYKVATARAGVLQPRNHAR